MSVSDQIRELLATGASVAQICKRLSVPRETVYSAKRRRSATLAPLAVRFWARVDRSGGPDACWPWLRGVANGGYGKLTVQRRMLTASRVAWELTFGPIPEGEDFHGKCVLHRCDNPPCCNPRHLFLGTHTDNMRDMAMKGRASRRAKGRPRKNREASAKQEAL